MADTRQQTQRDLERQAVEFDRPDYWMCSRCGAHNQNYWHVCQVCSSERNGRADMTTTLPVGRPYTMTQNVVYALPGRKVKVNVQGSDTIEESNDGQNFAAVTLTNDEAELACAFVRSTTGNAIICVK